MRILKRLLLAVLILVAGVLLAMYVASPVVTGRMLAMAVNGSLGVEAAVRGGGAAEIPVAPHEQLSIDGRSLQQAIDYGEATGSHALLVYHDGALLFGAAIRDGYIGSVDDPVGRSLPEWAQDPRGKVTIRQLLQQDSGIGFPKSSYTNPRGDFLQVMLGDELERTLLAQVAEGTPGARFDYSNVNAGLLGIVLQRATRMPYAQYLSTALWQRIGATDASVLLDSERHRTPRTFCCLDATARSWLQVGLLHLNDGAHAGVQVIPREWMHAVATPSANNASYGYLTWLGSKYQQQRRYNHKSEATSYQSEPYLAPDVRFFDGFGGQRVYVIPSKWLVIVRTGAISMDWDDARLPNLIIRGLKRTS